MILDWLLCVVRGADQRPRGGVPLPCHPPVFFLLALAHVLWCLLRIGQGHVAFIASKRCILWGLLRPPPGPTLAPMPHTYLALGLRLAGAAGMPEGRSGVPVTSSPIYMILYKSQVPIGFAEPAQTETNQSDCVRETEDSSFRLCSLESEAVAVVRAECSGPNPPTPFPNREGGVRHGGSESSRAREIVI